MIKHDEITYSFILLSYGPASEEVFFQRGAEYTAFALCIGTVRHAYRA
jgi:hypothetical protein